MVIKIKHKVTGTVYFVLTETFKQVYKNETLRKQYYVNYLVDGSEMKTIH